MSASSASPAGSVPSRARHGVGDLGGVERAHQREELAAGTGEPGHRARRIVGGRIGHGEHRAGGAERDRHIAGPETQTEGGAHVVAAARTDTDLIGQAQLGRRLARDRAGQIGRAEHQRDPIEPRRAVATDGGPEQAGEYLAGGRIDPTAAARIPAIGDMSTRQPPREVVVRQHHVGDPRQHFGFVLGDPGQLRDRERRDGHAARDDRPMLATQFGHQPFGLRRRRGVVPELGRPERRSGRVEQHQPVLLPGDRDRHDVFAMVVRVVRSPRSTPPTMPPGPARRPAGWSEGGRHGHGRRPSPVSRSRASTLVDCVDESTPSTSGITSPVRCAGRPGSRASPGGPSSRRGSPAPNARSCNPASE